MEYVLTLARQITGRISYSCAVLYSAVLDERGNFNMFTWSWCFLCFVPSLFCVRELAITLVKMSVWLLVLLESLVFRLIDHLYVKKIARWLRVQNAEHR